MKPHLHEVEAPPPSMDRCMPLPPPLPLPRLCMAFYVLLRPLPSLLGSFHPPVLDHTRGGAGGEGGGGGGGGETVSRVAVLVTVLRELIRVEPRLVHVWIRTGPVPSDLDPVEHCAGSLGPVSCSVSGSLGPVSCSLGPVSCSLGPVSPFTGLGEPLTGPSEPSSVSSSLGSVSLVTWSSRLFYASGEQGVSSERRKEFKSFLIRWLPHCNTSRHYQVSC